MLERDQRVKLPSLVKEGSRREARARQGEASRKAAGGCVQKNQILDQHHPGASRHPSSSEEGSFLWVLVLALLIMSPVRIHAQGRGAAPATAKVVAPIDLTGYWVAVISEDWRWRMVTPARGDYPSVPMTPEAQKIADAWDPAKDDAAGEQCRSYGAPGLMRAPTRLNITWEDDNTLKLESDFGMQTRRFHFGNWKAPGGAPTWQGDSVARWETPQGRAPVPGGPKRSEERRVGKECRL